MDKPIHLVPPAQRVTREHEREWSDTYAFKANLEAMRVIRRREALQRDLLRQRIYIYASLAAVAVWLAIFAICTLTH